MEEKTQEQNTHLERRNKTEVEEEPAGRAVLDLVVVVVEEV